MSRRIPPHFKAYYGIESILLKPNEASVIKLQKIAREEGEEWSPPKKNESGKKRYDPSVMILDTFFSDSSDNNILTDICQNNEAFPSIQILLVNPNSDFARRQPSLRNMALSPYQKLSKGLIHIVEALEKNQQSINKSHKENYRTFANRLIEHIQIIGESRNLEVRFYDVYPRNPMYFFNDILVSGQFGVKKDCLELPWYKIIDDPICDHDLYDEYRDEFEFIWEKSEDFIKEIDFAQSTNRDEVDIAIICALEKELDAVLTMNRGRKQEWEELKTENNKSFIYKKNLYSKNQKPLSIIACRKSDNQMGSTVSANLTTEIIQRFHPKVILLVGIAAGTRSDGRNIGDILIATEVVDYDAGKVIEEGGNIRYEYDSPSIKVNKKINNLFINISNYDESLKRIHDDASNIYDNLPERAIKIYSGTLVCRNIVTASQKEVNKIKERYRKFIGLEMESYGVYYSADNSSIDNPHFLCIKSVCDFADSSKNDSGQKLAAFTAAEFCHEFIVNHIDDISLSIL